MSFPPRASASAWRFFRFGMIVTGKGEEEFLPALFRSLAATGRCHFRVIRRIGQRSPIQSSRRQLRMIGSGKRIPDRDAVDIGLPSRRFLSSDDRYVLVIDDLERRRSTDIQQIFDRYRLALDRMLTENQANRASVHFLVNMLEAYYFADAQAVNAVLETDLVDFDGDVETIPNPKRDLKDLCRGFDEREHGRQIVERLNVPHMLSRADACCSLRTIFAWTYTAIEEPDCEIRLLLDGCHNEITKGQIDTLPARVD